LVVLFVNVDLAALLRVARGEKKAHGLFRGLEGGGMGEDQIEI
jgi:hypothetical protein